MGESAIPHLEHVILGDGRKLALRRYPGTGAPLVALHGLFDCSLGWKQTAGAMPGEMWALDLPGFGGSDLPLKPQLDAYARDIAEALRILGVREFALAGHSLGGAVASVLADRFPGRVRTLALIAPAGYKRIPLSDVLNTGPLRGLARLAMPFALGNRLTATAIYMLLISGGQRPESEQLERLTERAHSVVPGAMLANQALINATHDPDSATRRQLRYHGPAHIFWGERDHLVPISHLAAVQAALPQASTTVRSLLAHHPQLEAPTELAAWLHDSCCAQPSLPELLEAA
jgi:pimeloyl-ACP methyl ester carboxylesterase